MVDTASKHVLLVEDEKPLSQVLSFKLRESGFRVTVAVNGQEALDFLQREEVDIIVLDLIMPVMNGFDFIDTVQKKGIHTPILVLTNLGQKEDMAKIEKKGILTYLVKANTPLTTVVKTIKQMLET
jgi:CheY-like chemotaxis protein